MATEKNKKIFISFAIEDVYYRNRLLDQARLKTSPFDFIDMSLQKRLPEYMWRQTCKQKIKSSNGMIVLLSNNTINAHGAQYEIQCAKEIGIKVVGMIINKYKYCKIPDNINYMIWSWPNIIKFINSL